MSVNGFDTYHEVAEALGVRVCWGCDEAIDHEAGRAVEGPLGLVHWQERKVTRPGLYRFAVLAGIWRSDPDRRPHWLVFHEAMLWSQVALSETIGVRVPREYARRERARLSALLAHVPPRQRELHRDSFIKAQRWVQET
jgi:hypothetical protein